MQLLQCFDYPKLLYASFESSCLTRVGARVDRARVDHGSTGSVARRRVNVNTAYRRVETEIPLRFSTASEDQSVIVVIIITIG